MSKISVVYATKTQHSKTLAEAVAKTLGVEAKDIAKYPQPEETDLLFLVGAIYGGKCNPAILTYVSKLDKTLAKKVVLVTTSVSEKLRCQKEVREILKIKEIDIIDEITCTGAFLLVKAGHPNAEDIQGVTEKAKKLAEQFTA